MSPRSLPGSTTADAPAAHPQRLWRRHLRRLVAGLLLLALLAWPTPARASLEDDRYDGNIFALYAGNGSLVPPRVSLEEALDEHRVSVLIYYLDDSAVSKQFAGVVSELQRVWGGAIELLPYVTDPLQGRADTGPSDPLNYWQGTIPEVVVLNSEGRTVFKGSGQVELASLHHALSQATGIPLPPDLIRERTAVSFNELNAGWQSAPTPSVPRG